MFIGATDKGKNSLGIPCALVTAGHIKGVSVSDGSSAINIQPLRGC